MSKANLQPLSPQSRSLPPANSQPVSPQRPKPNGKHPPYLVAHRNTLIFRIRVPEDLRTCLDRTEYRRSLGRCYAAEAKLRALKLAAAAFEVFSFVRAVIEARGDSLYTPLTSPGRRCKKDKQFIAGSTTQPQNIEISLMDQENPDASSVSTPTQTPRPDETQQTIPDELQGRLLSSLTDDEIRSIADFWLLNALKANDLFILQAEHQQALSKAANLTLDDGAIIHSKHPTEATAEGLREQTRAKVAACQNIKEIYQRELRDQRVSQETAAMVDKQLAVHDITTDPETESRAAVAACPSRASTSYLKACRDFLQARVSFYNLMPQTAEGNYSAYNATIEKLEETQHKRRERRRIKVESSSNASAAIIPAAAQSASTSLNLPEALKLFFAENAREGKWSARTQVKCGHFFELFQAVIDPDGTLPVASISADHMRAYKEILFNMPPMRQAPYMTMPLPEVIARAKAGEIPEESKIAPKTIDNHFIQIKRFINWLAENEYHGNPKINGLLKAPPGKAPQDNRNPYTRNDLTKLFAPANFLTSGLTTRWALSGTPDSGGKASRFWIPLLGLFTGAREEELCQLHQTDIVAINREGETRALFTPGANQLANTETLLREMEDNQETLCISIRPGEEQSTKTDSSLRFVPLSSILVRDLGFLDYLASVHADYSADNPDSGRIFPELKKPNAVARYGNALSQWYNRYRRQLGVIGEENNKNKRKDFHSFRHTIGHWCDQIGEVNEKPAARYLGHSIGGITYGTYSKDTAPHILYEQITVPFTEYVRPLLDIEGLKQSKWARRAGDGGTK